MNTTTVVGIRSKVNRWPRRIKPHWIIPCGFFGGFLLGVIARAWMRWISTDPEFTWAGTIGILVGFVLFFTAHATVLFGKRKEWSRSWLTVARVVAVIFSFLLFSAQGAIMLPTVLLIALATSRTDWPKSLRRIIFLPGLIIPVIVVKDIGADFGWGLETVGRILLYVLIYSLVIAAARVTAAPLHDSWRMNRRVRSAILILLAASVGFVGIRIALN
ncbi:MAG: hypothetical protein AAB327_04800 [Actinomycetota bacterium]